MKGYPLNLQFTEKFYVKESILLGCLLFYIFQFNRIAVFLEPVIGREKDSVEWAPLYELAFEYIGVVFLSSLVSFLIAFIVSTLIHLFELKSLKELLLAFGSFGTTFPTIAVIALLVPSLGYGFKPVVVALVFYGIFPILLGTINALERTDRNLVQAGIGLGMTRLQLMIKVELPVAMSQIAAGVKTSFIINIAAATVGSVVGAGGLGMPIVSGIRTNDPVLILKGAIPVALIAMLTNQIFTRIERFSSWRTE